MDQGEFGQPERRDITVGRARLRVVRQGAGGSPSLVFLHTGICDHRSWEGVMDLLRPDMEVVAYDRRGFGATAYKPQRHDQMVDLLAVLDGLALGEVVLVGNSRGGQISLDFTLTHPGHVSALVLVAPGVSGAPEVDEAQIDQAEREIWSSLEAADAAGALEALNLGEIRLWLDGPRAAEGRVGGPVRELALDMNRIALHAQSPGVEPEPLDAWSRLSQVHCPVLVVMGDLDLLHLQERCREIATAVPGAQLRVMEGVAHLPALEQPAAFASMLREFLNGLSPLP